MKSFKEMKLKDQILATEMKLKGATFVDVARTYEFDYNSTRKVVFEMCKHLLKKNEMGRPNKMNDYYIRIHAITLLFLLEKYKNGDSTNEKTEPDFLLAIDEITFWKNTAAEWQKKAEEAASAGERIYVRSEDAELKRKLEQAQARVTELESRNLVDMINDAMAKKDEVINNQAALIEELKEDVERYKKFILEKDDVESALKTRLNAIKEATTAFLTTSTENTKAYMHLMTTLKEDA